MTGGHGTLRQIVDCTQVVIRGDISCLMAQVEGLIPNGPPEAPGGIFSGTLGAVLGCSDTLKETMQCPIEPEEWPQEGGHGAPVIFGLGKDLIDPV